MNRLPFTKYASKALNEGREIAGYLGFKDVSSIFVLLGLYGADGSLASEVLKMHGVTRELIEEAIKEKSKMPKDRRRTVMDTPKTEWNINKYHRFLHGEIQKYEGKKDPKTA